MQALIRFTRRENGGITVDWVVLTAGILGIMLAVATAMSDGTMAHADLTSQTMSSRAVGEF